MKKEKKQKEARKKPVIKGGKPKRARSKAKQPKGSKRKIHRTKLFRHFIRIAGTPVLLLALILTGLSIYTLNTALTDRTLQSLKAVGTTTMAALSTLDDGDYTINGEGIVRKGDFTISKNNQFFLNIQKRADMDVTFYYQDTAVATSVSDPETMLFQVGVTASPELVKDVLETGEDHFYTGIEQNGKSAYAYCCAVKNFKGESIGMLLVTMDKAETTDYIAKKAISMALCAIVMLVVGVILIFSGTGGIVKAILINKEMVDKLAEGDFAFETDEEMDRIAKRKDEIGAMLLAVQRLHEQLHGVIVQMKSISEKLLESGAVLGDVANKADSTAVNIGAAVQEVAASANNQANEVGQALESINQMSAMIGNIVTSVDSLNEYTGHMLSAQEVSQQNFGRLSATNNNTMDAIAQMGEQIRKTNASVKSINEAVDMISSIADQTKLLSLNASIEAARAGEAGRGFSVVAEEIQKLATESNESAARIKANIDEVVENSQSTMKQMESMQKILDEQISCLEETIAQFEQFAQGVSVTSTEARQIEEYASNCDRARASTESNMNTLAAFSQQNAAGAQETTASMDTLAGTVAKVADSSQEIEKVAKEISASLDFFKI